MKPIFMKTYLLFLILGIITHISAGEHKWIAVGDLHDWFSPTANEIEIGRTGATNTQQDGLQWNAQFRDQDVKAAKALWIATTNYDDPISNKFYNFKVIHNGPRGLDNESEFMAVENQWKLVGKYDSPLVLVDDIPASELQYDDLVDEVDPSLNCDRVLHTVVNTSIGVTINRKVYAFTQQNHSKNRLPLKSWIRLFLPDL